MTFERRQEAVPMETAYRAMYRFISDYYDRGGRANTIDELLADISVPADGMPVDAALWEDFLRAVDQDKGAQ